MMASGVEFKYLTSDRNSEIGVSNHSHCIVQMIWNPPTEECFSEAVLHVQEKDLSKGHYRSISFYSY
jgi:hypothetical protein